MRVDVTRLSRRLSWLLRHGANQVGLSMDAAGWTSIDQVLKELGITRVDLDHAVEHNDKGRLEVEGDRIRACQGHSLEGMPVTLEALEATWEVVRPMRPIWHGTKVGSIPGIALSGISPVDRTHVHLAEHLDSKVGKRSAIDLLLEVDPVRLAQRSIMVFRAPNGVFLTRCVPPGALIGVRASSPRGNEALAEVVAQLGLTGSSPDR